MSFAPGGGGGGSISGSSDAALSNAAQDNVLSYNGAIAKWQNVAPAQLATPKTLYIADHTLILADAGTFVDMSAPTALTLTVPDNTTVTFPVGTTIEVSQLDAGQVTIAAAAGVTLRTSATTTKLRTQWSVVALRKLYTNTWLVTGDLQTT